MKANTPPRMIPACYAPQTLKESMRRTAHHNEPSRGTPLYRNCSGWQVFDPFRHVARKNKR